MPRAIRHTAIASVLIPLLAACWESDRTSAASTSDTPTSGSTATVSTGATPSATTESGTASDKRRGRYGGAELRRRGAGVPPRPLRGGRQHVRGVHREQSRQRLGPLHARPLGLEDRRPHPRPRGVRRGAPARARRTGRASSTPRACCSRPSRPQDALDRVEQALAIEPLSAEGLRLKGRAHYELGQIDEAIDAYQRALAIDDRDVWAMNNLGYLYIQQGRSDAALPPLARAVELRGNVPVFQNNFGTALERVGALRLRPRGVPGGARGRQHLRQGRGRARAGDAHGAESDSSTVDVAGAVAGVPGGDRAVAGRAP